MNRIVLIGRLTKDPELRYAQTQTNEKIANLSFTIAVDRQIRRGDKKEVDFIACRVWRQGAEYLSRYAAKGVLISLEGKLQVRNFETKDGRRATSVEVVCDSVQILEYRNVSKEPTTNEYITEDFESKEEVDVDEEIKESYNIAEDDLPF